MKEKLVIVSIDKDKDHKAILHAFYDEVVAKYGLKPFSSYTKKFGHGYEINCDKLKIQGDNTRCSQSNSNHFMLPKQWWEAMEYIEASIKQHKRKTITISGYEAIRVGDIIKFGCVEVGRGWLMNLRALQTNSNIRHTPLTINETVITNEVIDKLLAL